MNNRAQYFAVLLHKGEASLVLHMFFHVWIKFESKLFFEVKE